jgi:ribosomal protein S12 methylthiotransferase accessory factor
MLKVDGIERTVPAAETISRLTDVAKSLGVTRLADITGLDRVGIPVYSSVVPKSDDALSVYNGKGVRRIDAQVGAIMEAIERQTVLKVRPPFIEGSYSELRRRQTTLDPIKVNQKLADDYHADKIYSWVGGLDIVSGEPCWVPAKLAGYFWDDVPHPSPFEMNDTNGVASGNCREEAMCHALCELAERDAWTLAEIGAHELPRLRRSLAFGVSPSNGPDDLEMFPCLDLNSNELMEAFHQAELFPVVRDITSSLGIPAVFASVSDDQIPGFPMAHSGLGAHLDVNVAVRRALTELAQSRCVDIQGVREDIAPPGVSGDAFGLHTRRISAINYESWYLGRSKSFRKLGEVRSVTHDTIEADLRFLVDRFAECGLTQIIVVDFTPDALDYSVVRVIVPGIEFWATDRGRLGARAVDFWKQHA